MHHVVSFYDEDLSWLNNYKNRSTIFIYSKNPDIQNSFEDHKITYLSNLGRESQTYLHHIIQHYDKLPDYIVFTQGNPYGHYNNTNIDKLFNSSDYFGFHKHFYVPDFRINEWGKEKMILNSDDSTLNNWLKKYIEKDIEYFVSNTGYYVSYGANIKVPKKNILSRSKDFYIKLEKQLLHKNPEVGHFFERSWYYIFNFHKEHILYKPDFIVVGSGLSGCVAAERLSEYYHDKNILILEKRNHIGGNCYDYKDEQSGIIVSKYGAHIFHTNNSVVKDYVNNFSDWIPFKHRVIGKNRDLTFNLPLDIKSFNLICGTNYTHGLEVKEYFKQVEKSFCGNPKNGEEYCLKYYGKDIYEKIFKYYTLKQWGTEPKNLPIEIFKRIKVFDYKKLGYFDDEFQALPKNGYTYFIENIIKKKNILCQFSTDYHNLTFDKKIPVFYTGPIDIYYRNLGFDSLEYRSIKFETEILKKEFFQEQSVINYTGNDVDFTRIVEYKHFYKNKSNYTIITKEYSTDTGEPYYPVTNKRNTNLYKKYQEYALKNNRIIFLGRLASFKYFNMDQAILNSLQIIDDYYENESY